MSYTTGVKTIEKSMNGLVTFESGGGVTIEGDTITTVNLDAENVECNTLVVDFTSTFNGSLPTSTQTTSNDPTQLINRTIGNTYYATLNSDNTFTSNSHNTFKGSNTFTNTNTFNTDLPTSTQTTSNALTQLINRTIGNTYYAQLNSDNTFTSNSNNTFEGSNTFTGLNTFNTHLPTSTQTTSNNLTQLINRSIGNDVYPQLSQANAFLRPNSFNNFLPTSTVATSNDPTQLINRTIGNTYYATLNSDNTFTSNSNNTFEGSNTFTGLNTFNGALPTSTQTDSNALTQLINRTIGNIYYAQLNSDNTFTSNSNNTFKGSNTFNGTNTFTYLPTSTQTTSNNLTQLINRTIGNTYYARLNSNNTFSGYNTFSGSNLFEVLPYSALTTTTNDNQFINKTIGNAVYPQLGTSNTFTGSNLFEVLPYTALTTTTNDNQFINKTIGNAVYPQLGTSNTFTTGINEFQGTNTKVTSSVAFEVQTPTTNINGTNCNVNQSTSLVVTTPTTNINGTNLNINSTGTLDVAPTTIFRKNVTLNNLVYMSATQTQYIAGGGASPSGVMTISAESNLQLKVGGLECLWMNNTRIPYVFQYPPTSLDHVVTKRYVDQEIATTVNLTTLNPVVIGNGSTGISGSIAIGQSADVLTGATDGIAIGNDTTIKSTKNNCTALGHNATCNQSESTAIGYNAVTNGVNQVCLGQANGTVRCGRITPMYPVASPIFSSGQIGFITRVNATAGNLTSTSYTDVCNAGIFPYGVYSITVFVDIHNINSIANFVSYSLQTVTTNTILQESNLFLVNTTKPNQSAFTYYYEANQSVKLSLKINNGNADFSSHTNISLVRIA